MTDKTPSDTPRTDKLIAATADELHGQFAAFKYGAMEAHARQLEREIGSISSSYETCVTAIKAELTAAEAARDAALEDAAKVCEAHQGSAAKRRGRRNLSTYDDDTAMQIQSEERGEDIASAMCAAAIRAMKGKP